MKKRVNVVYAICFAMVILLAGDVSAASLTPGNIDSCGELDTADSVYTLNESIASSGACFTIESNNVTLDGNGFTISYASGSGKIAVKINSNLVNVTVKNAVITKSGSSGSTNHGIEIDSGTNYSQIINNTIITNGSSTNFGIYLDTDTYSNNISLNNVTGGGTSNCYAIYLLTNSSGNTIDSNIVSTSATGTFNYAIQLSNSTQNTIKLNNITTGGSSNNVGINLQSDSNENNIISNIISANGANSNHGINIQTGSSQNNVTLNTVNTSGSTNSHGLNIVSVGSQGNSFSLNIFGMIAGNKLNFATAGITGTIFTNQSISNYSFTGTGSKITIENTTFGKIKFTTDISGSGSDFYGTSSSDIFFGNNSVFVNSSSNSGLNVSANVTLYGIGDRGFTNPVILKNGELCLDCSNFTSLINGTVVFNVTNWSNYSIGEGPVTSVAVEETVEETSSSTSSGGTGYPFFRPRANQLNRGYNKMMEENWGILFLVENKTHTFKVKEISDTDVKISVASEIQEATLLIGQEKEFYISKNDYVLVKLHSINTAWWKNQADITIQLLHKEIKKDIYETSKKSNITINQKISIENENENETMGEISEMESSNWIWVVIVVIVVIVVGVLFKKFFPFNRI